MKILVAEDDFTSRLLLQRLLSPYGEVQIAINGREAISAFRTADLEGAPYALVCLDIMMPEMDGQEVLSQIRTWEASTGRPPGKAAKIIMTTALKDGPTVMSAFREQCDAYLVKPIDHAKLKGHLMAFGLAA